MCHTGTHKTLQTFVTKIARICFIYLHMDTFLILFGILCGRINRGRIGNVVCDLSPIKPPQPVLVPGATPQGAKI